MSDAFHPNTDPAMRTANTALSTAYEATSKAGWTQIFSKTRTNGSSSLQFPWSTIVQYPIILVKYDIYRGSSSNSSDRGYFTFSVGSGGNDTIIDTYAEGISSYSATRTMVMALNRYLNNGASNTFYQYSCITESNTSSSDSGMNNRGINNTFTDTYYIRADRYPTSATFTVRTSVTIYGTLKF